MLLHPTTLAALDNRTLGPNNDHSAPRRRHRQQVQCLWAQFDCSSLSNPVSTPTDLSRTRAPVKLSWAGTAKGTGVTGMCSEGLAASFLITPVVVRWMVARRELPFQRPRLIRLQSNRRWPLSP